MAASYCLDPLALLRCAEEAPDVFDELLGIYMEQSQRASGTSLATWIEGKARRP